MNIRVVLVFCLTLGCKSYSCEYPSFISKDVASLLFFDLDARTQHDYVTHNVIGLKIGTMSPFGNRVYSTADVAMHDIDSIKTFFRGFSFKWWVGDNQIDLPMLLMKAGFVHDATLHLMKLDLEKLQHKSCPNVQVIAVSNAEELDRWIRLVAQVDNLCDEDFKKEINYLSSHSKIDSLRLYLALCDGRTVGTSMMLVHDDMVTVHGVGVLPEFRRRGIASALTTIPLLECARQGKKEAYLVATRLGEGVYRKIGFQNYCTFHLYVYNNPK